MYYEYKFDEYRPSLSGPSLSFDLEKESTDWKLTAEGIGPSSGVTGELSFDVRNGILNVYNLDVSHFRRGIGFAMFGFLDSNFEFDCSVSNLTSSNFDSFRFMLASYIRNGFSYEDALENSFRNMPSVKIRRGFGFSTFVFEPCADRAFCMTAER